MTDTHFAGVAQALATDPGGLLAAWLDAFESSAMRMPAAVDRRALEALVEPAFSALASAFVDSEEAVSPGSHSLRDTERLFSFAGASLASAAVSARETSAYDASALGVALRTVLMRHTAGDEERDALIGLCDWLTALLVESFAASGRNGERERFHELLEQRVPVFGVPDSVAAAIVIGDSSCGALASALERLVLQVARAGASAVVIDVAGLDDPHLPHNLRALEQFAGHRKISGTVSLGVVGLGVDARRSWERVARDQNVVLEVKDTFLEAALWAKELSDAGAGRK